MLNLLFVMMLLHPQPKLDMVKNVSLLPGVEINLAGPACGRTHPNGCPACFVCDFGADRCNAVKDCILQGPHVVKEEKNN